MPATRFLYKNPIKVTLMFEESTYEAFRLWCHSRRRSVSQTVGALIEKVLEENPSIIEMYQATPKEKILPRKRGRMPLQKEEEPASASSTTEGEEEVELDKLFPVEDLGEVSV